ncbi:MAG: DUF3137 domain-containing protein [Pseudomonadota bacterium]
MEFKFTENAPHEEGFSPIFHEKIVPILKHHEGLRKEYAKQAMIGMGGSGTVGVGGAGAGVGYESEFGLLGGGVGLFGIFAVRAYYQNKWKGGLGGEILPILCDFLGEVSYGSQMIDVNAFTRLGVIPSYNESSLDDPVNGTHDGLSWAMTEAILKTRSRDSKGRTRTSTVFRGLLFSVEIVGPAPRIFFGTDRGGVGNWFSETFSSSRKGLEKLEVDHPEFERVYEVYASDPDAARRYLNGNLISGLLEVAKSETSKKYIACAMEGDRLYLALPRSGDFLGLGSLFRPVTTIESDLHEALADLTLPGRLIDKLRHG